MVSSSLMKARYNRWTGMRICSLIFLAFANLGSFVTYSLTHDTKQLVGFGVMGAVSVIMGFFTWYKSDRYYRLYVESLGG